LSKIGLNPFGIRGASPSPTWLQAGQGMPAPRQLQARSPNEGRSGWFSQTHPVSSQREQFAVIPGMVLETG
jgi:hypothetical protein